MTLYNLEGESKEKNTYSEIDYLLYKICFHCAPTLKKKKPASLMCFKNSKSAQMRELWHKHKNEIARILGCDFYELKVCHQGINVLFYQREFLNRVLTCPKTMSYIKQHGYSEGLTLEKKLSVLKDHYREGCPHEIGIFLGYPLSDVVAFNSPNKDKSIGCGYWRVYSDLEKAQKTFNLYDECRAYFVQAFAEGNRPFDLFWAC